MIPGAGTSEAPGAVASSGDLISCPRFRSPPAGQNRPPSPDLRSTHDSTAFALTRLASVLESSQDSLPAGYYIVGDDAYPCSNKILTPWPGKNLSVWKDSFNFWQSSARIHIEQAFGIVKMRWGILWRPLGLTLQKVSLVVSCCLKLHNFILDNVQEEDMLYCMEPFDQGAGASREFYVNFCPQDLCDTEHHQRRRRRDLERSTTCEDITQRIEELRLRRPMH